MSDILTDAEIQEIEEYLGRATPEPWLATEIGGRWQVRADAAPLGKVAETHADLIGRDGTADVEFIARSRTDLPRALETIRHLREILSTAYGFIAWMSGSDDFAPGGIAHEGWLKSQTELEEIRAVLASLRSSEPRVPV